MKPVRQSGIPPLVVVPVSVLRIAFFYSVIGDVRGKCPSLRQGVAAFRVLSETLEGVLPFLLEIFVTPQLPLFIFAAIISTMPILTTIPAALAGVKTVNLGGFAS